jgi:hypothetical protein
MAEPLGYLVKLQWLNRGMVWEQLRWLELIKHKSWDGVGTAAHTGGETLVGMLQAR